MGKYYAVRNGKRPGIYDSWIECKKQVEGFSNAEYKSFSTLEEAQRYIASSNVNSVLIKEQDSLNKLKAYVDGSYSKDESLYAYGCVLIHGDKIERLSGIGNDSDLIELWNVAGELTGAMKAIEWAKANNYNSIVIYHDYEGIAKWANQEWKANKKGTKDYIDFIKKTREFIQIDFVKVAAHTGVQYNEEADFLAKKAIKEHNKQFTELVRVDESSRKTMEEKLFFSTMAETDNVKNKVSIIYEGVQITETKLKKFAKTYWKAKGYKINEIEDFGIQLEWSNLDIKITMNFEVRNGESQEYILFIRKPGGK